MLVNELCKYNDAFEFQRARLYGGLSAEDKKLYAFIDTYLEAYAQYHNLSVKQLCRIRERFANEYVEDIKCFATTQEYPKDRLNLLSRVEYDVVLISSFLLEKHRFKIAQWLASQDYNGSDIAVIGIGPGVEMAIITDYLNADCVLTGYDIELSDYVSQRFLGKVKKAYFSEQASGFDKILLIEILEHVTDPQQLINTASRSLKQSGVMYATTALNVPQFDHVYNFEHREIETMLSKANMKLTYFENVVHVSMIHDIGSANELFEAKKV